MGKKSKPILPSFTKEWKHLERLSTATSLKANLPTAKDYVESLSPKNMLAESLKANLPTAKDYAESLSPKNMLAEEYKRLTNLGSIAHAHEEYTKRLADLGSINYLDSIARQHPELAYPFSSIGKSISDISKRAYNSLHNMESFNLVSSLSLPLSELTAIGIDPYDYSYEEYEDYEDGDYSYEEDEDYEDIEENEVESIDNESIIIRLDEDRRIKVCSRNNNANWTYIDGNSLLPSDIYVPYHSNWKNILDELEDIINDPKTKESDLQKFLEENPDFLREDTYDVVIPQACIVPEDRRTEKPWQADFILAPLAQYEFCKILELKVPTIPISRKKRSGHQKYSAKFWEAIKQLKDYGEAFHDSKTRNIFKEKYGIETFKPDLHLIIGREWNDFSSKEMLILQREQFVKIDNWDSYLSTLKRKFK
jgi:hypothetical protein